MLFIVRKLWNQLKCLLQEICRIVCGTSTQESTHKVKKNEDALYELVHNDFQDILLTATCKVRKNTYSMLPFTLKKTKKTKLFPCFAKRNAGSVNHKLTKMVTHYGVRGKRRGRDY